MEAEGSLWSKKAPGVWEWKVLPWLPTGWNTSWLLHPGNISDLHVLREEFQSGGTATSPSETSPRNTHCHVPAQHPLVSCLQPQAFKNNKKGERTGRRWKYS